MKRELLIGCLVAVLFCWQGLCFADDGPEITQMTLHPAAEPVPALKYKLLPGFIDKRPGNAAVLYNRLWMENFSLHKHYAENADEISSWNDMPLDELPQEKVEVFVRMTRGIYRDFKWASRLDTCDWSQPIREGNPLLVLLPDIQQSRTPARFLAIRARWQIAQGQFDDAIETLRVGYALGRNVAESPCLVSDLVGIAICNIMSQQIETMIQQPDSPNMYWALTNLPRPLIDTRGAFEAEYDLLFLACPELRHVDDPAVGAAQAQLWIERMVREPACWQHNAWDAPSGLQQEELRATLTGMILKGYPKARRALIAQGRSAEQVEAMPVTQAVAIYTVQVFKELRDEKCRWFSLPLWQAAPGLEKADKDLRAKSRRLEIIPFGRNLLPAIQAVKIAEARNQRTIALLRTIEALRLHAAAHDGRLPEKLSDITEVPIPTDPFTGKPIECKIDDGVAVLEVYNHYQGMKKLSPSRRIEIRMAK